jgi:hypothetical protein
LKKKKILTLCDFKTTPTPYVLKKANGPIFVKFWKRFFCTRPPLPKIQPPIIPNFGGHVEHKMHPNRTFFLARQLLVAHTMPIWGTLL